MFLKLSRTTLSALVLAVALPISFAAAQDLTIMTSGAFSAPTDHLTPGYQAESGNHVTIVHVVSPHCFYPEPRVDSTIVVLERRDTRTKLEDGAPFHQIVRLGFNQRRKMLRKLIAEYKGVAKGFQAAAIAPTARAEELNIEQWIILANTLKPA